MPNDLKTPEARERNTPMIAPFKARYKDGVLTIDIAKPAKPAAPSTRKIPVAST